jgi:osmotically-inducible protein OsmY
LRGELPSFYAKQVAQEAVKAVEGITGINNDIKVTS